MECSDERALNAALASVDRQISVSPSYPFRVDDAVAAVYLVGWAQSHIDNGGLAYFFEMEVPGAPPYAEFCKAYCAIGAVDAARCIELAVAKFPFSEPHRKCEERLDFMYPSGEYDRCDHEAYTQFAKSLFDALDAEIYVDHVWEKMLTFVKKHGDKFET